MTIASKYLSNLDQNHALLAFNSLNGRMVALFMTEHAKLYYLVTSSIWWEEESYTNEPLTAREAYDIYTSSDMQPQVAPEVAFPNGLLAELQVCAEVAS